MQSHHALVHWKDLPPLSPTFLKLLYKLTPPPITSLYLGAVARGEDDGVDEINLLETNNFLLLYFH